MERYDENTKLSELTVGELRDLVRAVIAENSADKKRTVHGLKGLADLLGVSVPTVKRYRGLLSPAIAQHGRTIVVDADKALKLWSGKRKTFQFNAIYGSNHDSRGDWAQGVHDPNTR